MSEEPLPIRRAIAALVAEGGGRLLPVDVLERSGIRADHELAALATPPNPVRPVGVGHAAATTRTPTLVDTTAGSGEWDEPPPVAVEDALIVDHARRLEDRYEVVRLLGEGGMGEVHLARDRNLGREVAVKTIPPHRMDARRLARFVAEARITAQLEHPGIVPIHDLFISGQGDIYYTMKRVQGRTLRDVLDDLGAGDAATVERWNLNRLLGVFLTACQAVAYAHTRRVIHRDLKPDNIMLGDFGEVLLMDWGVARMLDDAEERLQEVVREGASLLKTADGAMVGSPAYMAPESLRGETSTLSPASDVYSLGVILYEILTLHRPVKADTLGRLLYLVIRGEFQRPAERAPGRDIPADVEAICLKALAREPQDRYADAGQLTVAVEEWLERVRPRQEADRLVAGGKELMLLFARAASDAEEAELKARLMGAELKSWDPLDMKRLVWEAERARADAMARADSLFGDCEAAFESALSHLPQYRPAREGLADLYWIRFLQAEESADRRWMRRWEELILRYAPERYERRLRGSGTITLSTSPPGARATLYPLEEEDGRRIPGAARPLGSTPLVRIPSPMGSYELRLSLRGQASLRFPLVLRRLQNLEASVRLPPAASVPEGAIPIPAGPAVLGGDPIAISGLPEADVYVGDFAIFRYPVTVGEYLPFLADLARVNPEAARLRSPRSRGSRGVRQDPLFLLPQDASYALPFIDRDGTAWHSEQPIVSISIDDARAYAAWLSRLRGIAFRLPTESEWEKAARGLDRRTFPWGDRFDSSFCVMSESSPDMPDLPAIGAVPSDVSPYGVRDMGGGIRDWCEWDSEEATSGGRFPIRGGSYGTVEVYCRCASRSVVRADYVGSHVGFRLVVDL